MADLQDPPDAEVSASLLIQFIGDIACSVSFLSLSLSPDSLAHRHSSALARLLDAVLAACPPPPQHRLHPRNGPAAEPESAPLAPNSLLQLDILRVLFFVAGSLRLFFLTVAKSRGDDALDCGQSSAGAREEAGLLSRREVYQGECSSCFERAMALLRLQKSRTVEEAVMDATKTDANELRKWLMESMKGLQEYLDCLEGSLQKVIKELSSTVALIKHILTSSQDRTIFSTASRLRAAIRQFLDSLEEDQSDMKDLDTYHGDEKFLRDSEVLVKQLLNPRGAKIVGLGGGRGLGKTCLASHILCSSSIVANFPGGIFYVYVGNEPKLTSLQAQLWKQMCGRSVCYSSSQARFKTPEEGTAALTSHAREGLPCLLILDDVCDADHLKPFLCFDREDGWRMLVVSRAVKSVLEICKDEAFVLLLESWDAEEAHSLFQSVAGCQDAEKARKLAAMARFCHGTPRLIEAAASAVYYGEANPTISPSISNFLKQVVVTRAEENQSKIPLGNLPSRSVVSSEGEENSEVSDEEEEKLKQSSVPLNFFSDSTDSRHLFLDSLAEVHPGLEECFLDLAAFPKGTWVSLSTLMDIWSFGNEMEHERALFVLCFLASRCLVEWKLDMSVDDDFDQFFPSHWRMVDFFHEIAQSFIQRKLKDGASKFSEVDNNKKEQVFDLCQRIPANSAWDADGILDLLRTALDNLDTFAWMQTKGNTCCVSRHKSKKWYNPPFIDLESKTEFTFLSSMLLQTNCRFFFPGSQSDNHTDPLADKKVANKITKLSLISTNLTKFPAKVDLCQLKVALLSSNAMLKSLPERPFKCMEHLVVLNLKNCTSLTLLPDSICTLPCLEVLELSGCVGLLSLPRTIGKLKSLKCLNLSHCLSLTCLPLSMGRLKNLLTMNLSSCSRMKSLPKTLGNLISLQMLNLSECYSMQCLPNTIGGLQKLHSLVINKCSNLSYTPWFDQLMNMIGGRMNPAMAVPPQFWKLRQIEVLHLCSLKNLAFLPQSIGKLQHLRHLDLSGSRSLDYLPDEIGSLFLLENLDLSHTAIRKLPPSLGQLGSLVRLSLQGCSRLLCIPPTLCGLLKLERLEMAECWDFVMLPDEFGAVHSLPKLLELDLSGCSIKTLPCFMQGALPVIQRLSLANCENLTTLSSTFGTLTSLERLDLGGCKSIVSLQDIGFGELKQLQWINLRNCTLLTVLPVSEFLGLQSLNFLDVSGCTKLSPFPEPLLRHAREHKFTLVRWGALWH